MRPKSLRERRTDALHAIQTSERAERSVALAVLNDPGGERGADTRQPFELLQRREVDVDGAGRFGRHRW